jgi:hypothetical protein
MPAFRLRSDVFSNGQDARISLLVVDEMGGTVEKVHFPHWPPELQSSTPHSGNRTDSHPLRPGQGFAIQDVEDLHRVL